VYMASEFKLHEQQRQRRLRLAETLRQPTTSEAIAILVEKIKHPTLSVTALSRRITAQNLRVEPETIDNFLSQHGLTVKKTPPTL